MTTTTPTFGFLTEEWAETVRERLDHGPSEETLARKQESYWEWIAATRGVYSHTWALGVQERDGSTSYLHLTWQQGKCAKAGIVAPGEPVSADFVIVGTRDTWRQFLAGELDHQRMVVDKQLRLVHGNILIFFRAVFFFIECLAVLEKVPTSFDSKG
jgi:putative sterol carrier protein